MKCDIHGIEYSLVTQDIVLCPRCINERGEKFTRDVMENEKIENDGHRFGESDYLNADDFAVGAVVKVPCVSWIGRKEYQTRDSKTKKAGFYQVEDRGAKKEFRL